MPHRQFATLAVRSIHPGAILEEEFLEPLGLSARALASAISVPGNRFTALIHGERAITVDTALRLARFFDMSPEFWLGLQMDYDLEAARASLGDRLEREVTPRAAWPYERLGRCGDACERRGTTLTEIGHSEGTVLITGTICEERDRKPCRCSGAHDCRPP